MRIDITFDCNGFTVFTPYSTNYCDSISDVLEIIENLLLYYMEVKRNEEQKKR